MKNKHPQDIIKRIHHCIVIMTSSTSTRRVRLKRLLILCGFAITLYLATHLYISYRLTHTPSDLDGQGNARMAPTLTCITALAVDSVVKKLPAKPTDGVFYMSHGSDTEVGPFSSATSVRLAYTVDERFPPLLSLGETEHTMRLVRKLSSILSSAGVTFTLWQGSVLGSYMTHGLLPWDDDVDLAIAWSDMPKVKLALKDATSMWRIYNITSFMEEEGVDLYSQAVLKSGDIWGKSIPGSKPRYHRFKFFAVDSSPAGNSTWNWPNVDVVYLDDNATHLWTYNEPEIREIVPKKIFFPLHSRPFGSLWLPAPADTRGYLTLRYGHEFSCATPTHNHRQESPRQSLSVPCCALYRTYPIVYREAATGGVVESLLLGNSTLHSVFVKEQYVPGIGPYQI